MVARTNNSSKADPPVERGSGSISFHLQQQQNNDPPSGDDADCSTVPMSGSTRPTPLPSVLRNPGGGGAYNSNDAKILGINGGFSSSDNQHIELRSKRISARRRAQLFFDSEESNEDGWMRVAADKLNDWMPRSPKAMVVAFCALVGVACVAHIASHPAITGALGSAAGGGVPERRLKKNLNSDPNSDFLDDFDQRRRRAADLPDGTVFSEPAHTRMCRSIVDRLDAYDAGTTTFEQVIFTESEYVCRDPDAPYTSVLNMFAAQLLHEANNQIGLNVDYTHRCAKWERFCTGNMTTVQFHLPDPLSMTAYAWQDGCIDAAMLRTICTNSLASSDPTDPDNILFPSGYLNTDTNTCSLECYFNQVLPWIRNNLRVVATNWLNTVESRALTFWLRNAAEFSHREKDDMEVSVVSLSCAVEDCDMSQTSCVCEFTPLPNWVYAMHIPRSSTNVAIVVSPTCAKFGEGCTLHAQELYHFFQTLYPRADITWNVITSTSSWYMRMITADVLVCPPGEGCLLPAIARDAYTYVYEKTSPTVSTWLTCVPANYLTRFTTPTYPPVFLQGDCRHLRARIGAWAQDAALAPSLQYSTPVDGYLGCADTNFVATAEDPYRPPTTYRWDENVWATCPVTVMTQADLCTQMDRLGLARILFVGDHTTMTQAISLASILGQGDGISLDTSVVPNFTKTITCAGTTIGSFELSYIRNDRLEEPGTTPSPGFPNCGPTNKQYCYPWSTDYANYLGSSY